LSDVDFKYTSEGFGFGKGWANVIILDILKYGDHILSMYAVKL
jgi:hypothetical protein